MQKWEYLEVTRDAYDTYLEQINGENVIKQKMRFFDYINKIGQDGWERVISSSWQHWTFKRPKL